ncbi:MAG: GntR family transcriptional regulator, partial [Actinocatenispora sp.]
MGTAPYERIVADLRARIEGGELAPGARVPSTRQLIAEYGVAMATASKALSALRQAGLVHPVRGVGTVVAGPDPVARPGSGTPGPDTGAAHRPGVGRDDLVRAAIALADAEGLAGLSMRRIATRLGIATMSVYRHVQGRDELVVLMLDRAIGEHPLPADPPPGWRARAET